MPHPLTNFEIQKYYQNEPRFNGVCSRDNLPKIKDGAYVINLDEYSDIGIHWVALYMQNNNVAYINSFGVEHIPIWIEFIDFLLAGKTLTEFKKIFSPNNFKKNDDIILEYFISNVCKNG